MIVRLARSVLDRLVRCCRQLQIMLGRRDQSDRDSLGWRHLRPRGVRPGLGHSFHLPEGVTPRECRSQLS